MFNTGRTAVTTFNFPHRELHAPANGLKIYLFFYLKNIVCIFLFNFWNGISDTLWENPMNGIFWWAVKAPIRATLSDSLRIRPPGYNVQYMLL